MMVKRVVVGGCRDFNDYTVLSEYLDTVLSNISKENDIIILSGHCRGVDTLAERYAEEHGYKTEIYPAEWDKYGKSAGPKRNKLMVDKSDYVVAFWDKQSRGTKSLIEYAMKQNKPIRVKDIRDHF